MTGSSVVQQLTREGEVRQGLAINGVCNVTSTYSSPCSGSSVHLIVTIWVVGAVGTWMRLRLDGRRVRSVVGVEVVNVTLGIIRVVALSGSTRLFLIVVVVECGAGSKA